MPRSPPRTPGRGYAGVVVLGLCLAGAARAEEPPAPGLPPDGSELFRAVLAANGVKPIRDVWDQRDPAAVIVVCWGRQVGGALPSARHAYRGGGAVLVATNRDTDLARLGLDPNDEDPIRVETPTWTGLINLPPPNARVNPFALFNGDTGKLLLDPDVSPRRPVRSLVTVAPAVLRTASRQMWPKAVVATVPDQVRFDRQTMRREYAGNAPFVAGGRGPGVDFWRPVVVAVADHGVLTNRSLLDPAGDNWNFALNLAAALKGEGRAACLFLEDEQPVTDFSAAYSAVLPPPPPLPLPSLDAIQERLVDGVNKAADRLQANDGLTNRLLGRTAEERDRRFRDYAAAVAVSAGVWAVWYLLRKVWKSRQSQEPRPPAIRHRPLRPADTVASRREDELLGRDNLYEPARAVARGVFRDAGLDPHADAAPPAVEYPRGPFPAVARSLADLWRVGYGPAVVVPFARWREIETRAAAVRRAAADGVWRLAPASGGAV